MKITLWGFLKFVLWCIAITAFIYLTYLIWPSIKASVTSTPFISIMINSAAATVGVIGALVCTTILLVPVACIVYNKLSQMKIKESRPKERFDDLIVADNIKEKLQMLCGNISKEMREAFEKIKFKLPQNYLFHGPPGTGKTLIAKVIAGEMGIKFFSVSAKDIISMFVGGGAKNVHDLFERARKNSPCIIFIDEIEAIGKKRGGTFGSGESNTEIVNQLLTEMDGLDNNNEGIIVIAATNHIDSLDEALIRPGRFTEHIEISLPDEQSRNKILCLYMTGVQSTLTSIDFETLAKKTKDFSGADLSDLVNRAKYNAAKRDKESTAITMNDFDKALEDYKKAHPEPKCENSVSECCIRQFLLKCVTHHDTAQSI